MAVERQTPDFSHVTFMGDRPVAVAAGRAAMDAAAAPAEALDPAVEEFFSEVCAWGGTEVGHYRHGVLLRRRAACLRALRAGSQEQAVRVLRRDPAAAERALGAVMIGVTQFFRKPQAFEALRPLLRGMRGGERFSGLSIGCSTGQEVYSLAMLLADEGMLEGAELVGVDCREEAIRTAEKGVYSAAALVDAPEHLRERFAWSVGGGGETRYRIAEELRRVCRWVAADAFAFARGEVAGQWADRTFDIVMCRNLAIYLKPAAAEELWRLLGARLKSGGVLMAGKAERPSPRLFCRIGPCLYQARSEG